MRQGPGGGGGTVPSSEPGLLNAEPTGGSPRINAAGLDRRLIRTRVTGQPVQFPGTSLTSTLAVQHNSRTLARSTGEGHGSGATVQVHADQRQPDPGQDHGAGEGQDDRAAVAPGGDGREGDQEQHAGDQREKCPAGLTPAAELPG